MQKLAKRESRISSVRHFADHFSDRLQSVAEIHREFRRGHPSSHRARDRTIPERASQTIAMAGIDRDRVLRRAGFLASILAIISSSSPTQPVFLSGRKSAARRHSSSRRAPAGRSCSRARSLVGPSRGSANSCGFGAFDRRCATGDRRSQAIFSVRAIPSLLELILGFAQPGGIEQAHRHAAQIDHFFDRVAGRARNVTDDRAVETEQAIEQLDFPALVAP